MLLYLMMVLYECNLLGKGCSTFVQNGDQNHCLTSVQLNKYPCVLPSACLVCRTGNTERISICVLIVITQYSKYYEHVAQGAVAE